MKNNCQHDIGIFHDYDCDRLITIKTLKQVQPHTIYTLKQYLDGRTSTNLQRFIYCPWCGEKIDWKRLRNETLKG